MTSKEGLVVHYPNFENNELPLWIGCVSEENIDNAKNFFLRCCHKDVIVHKVVAWKRNCQPSCAWKVIYKLRDRTPPYVEDGQTVEDFILHLPEDDADLKNIFEYITAMVCGMRVVQKGYTADKVYAVVDYVPLCCVCPVKDFSEAAKLIPLMRSSVTEVSLTFSNIKL